MATTLAAEGGLSLVAELAGEMSSSFFFRNVNLMLAKSVSIRSFPKETTLAWRDCCVVRMNRI